MKYWELINIKGQSTCCPVDIDQANDDTKVIPSVSMSDIIQTGVATPPPPGFDETSLDDSQISLVVEMLLGFKDKYFSEIPLMDELQKSFVWNIPKDIYDVAERIWVQGRPDCLNPIYWFYMFCIDPSIESIAKFLVVAFNAMKNSDFEEVEQLADRYDDLNDIETDDDEDSYEEDDEIVPFAFDENNEEEEDENE